MDLQEAKNILRNKGYTLLKEDANSDGVRKAKEWIEVSDALSRTGCSSVQELIETARHEFSHFYWRQKGQDRFLPGVIRIAIDDCGWLSGNEDPNDILELKAMFVAATDEFLAYKQNNPGQPFDLNADFNGLSFDELHNALGSRAINVAKAKLTEAKKLLQNKGYKLIREDAYMDAMDQELDDIRQNNIKSSDSITLKFPNISPEKLEAFFNKFENGNANPVACKALGRVCDLMGRATREQDEQIKTLTPGESITFTTIPEWFGRFPMYRNHFLEYCRHYGKDVMLKLIALACTKNNAATLGAI